MKKILLFICMILGVCGCSCNKDELIKMKKGETPGIEESSSYLYDDYGLLTYEFDSTDDYDVKINDKDSFILFVYREGCFGCQKLSPAIKDYIDDNEGAIVYSMKTEIINSSPNHSLYKTENISGTPWIILVENGNIVYKVIMPVENDTDAKAKTWFYDLMEKHVSWEE